MQSPRDAIDPQKVYLDPVFLSKKQVQAGMGMKDYAEDLPIDYRTLRDILQGGGVMPSTAKALADYFKEDVLAILAPWDPRYEPTGDRPGMWSPFTDWEAKGLLEQGRLAPNGLYYIVCRMEHRHTKGKLGRGKFYHLFWLRREQRQDAQHQLTRHADVCARVGSHPNLAVNHTSTPLTNDEGWWVIDDWIGEKTLADHLAKHPWPIEELPRLLLEIAKGLEALHAGDVIFRELAPTRVLLADKDDRAVLTDFELAKLLDGSPSVSSDWPEDPFRAPEVEEGEVTVRADLFSLAQIAAAAIAGSEFDVGRAPEILGSVEMPKSLKRLLIDASQDDADRRPAKLAPILKGLATWTEKTSRGRLS